MNYTITKEKIMGIHKSYELIKDFHPIENKTFSILQSDGSITDKKIADSISPKNLLEEYKKLLYARTADEQIIAYQRQGRIFTYPPVQGHEITAHSVGYICEKDDWIVPSHRELAVALQRGVSLKEIFLLFMGYEEGAAFKNAHHVLPYSVPIGSQLPHATGIAYARKYLKKNEVTFAFVGEGGTSEGDFHESVNFASVWNVPVVFVITNNQYAISTPVDKQTNSDNFAVKAVAYGIPGIKVDGNDFLAMAHVAKIAREYAIKNNSPVIIESVTYRRTSHTTSDDPSRYRTKEEEFEWEAKDGYARLKNYLIENKVWSEKEHEAYIAEIKEEIDAIFVEAENHPKYELNDVFDHVYSQKPTDLIDQQEEIEEFLHWKKTNL